MRLMRTEANIDHNHITGLVFLATSAPMCLDGTSLSGDNDDTGGGGRTGLGWGWGGATLSAVNDSISLLYNHRTPPKPKMMRSFLSVFPLQSGVVEAMSDRGRCRRLNQPGEAVATRLPTHSLNVEHPRVPAFVIGNFVLMTSQRTSSIS